MYLNYENAECVGLFNKIQSSTICKLGVINSYFNGNIEIGSICGYSHQQQQSKIATVQELSMVTSI
ncbi:MAG: hypothetical protein V8S74_02760 [Lachnospirales bacterium]